MYKVIDLGCDFPQTGEPRVRLLDSGLVKTASTEIQDFWAQLTPSDSCAYLWVIGVSAVEYYGCNRNGDAFLESELKRTHHHFTDTAHIFLHHVNRDPNKSIGKPIFSWYNDDMHRVELILEIRKGAEGADAIVDKIRRGEQLYVSMGCSVEVDRCSICGHESKTRAQYCDHLRYNMKKILPDGRQVFAYNPNPKFFDISIVRKPADPTAFALDKIASYNNGRDYRQKTITSAELGEKAIDLMQKRAAISKLSDIFKSIDAVVADSKLPEEIKERCDRELYHQGFMDAMRVMHEHGFENLGNTILDHDMLNKDGVSPCGLLKILASHNAPLSISDAAWMAAKHFMTDSPSESLIGNIVNAIPSVLPLLAKRPSAISELVEPILNDYRGENLDGILDHYSEPLRIRVVIVRKMPIVKTAETVYNEPVFPDDTGVAYGSLPSTILPRYKKLHFKTQDGRIFETTPEALGILTKGGFPQSLLTTKGLGATLAAASLLSLIAAPSVFGAAGLVGGTLLATGKDPQMIKSMEGVEVPISTLMQSYKRQVTQPVAVMQKSAGLGTNLAAGVGAMIPAGLAVDYALNQRRYGQGYENNPNISTSQRMAANAGNFAWQNPALAVGSGMVGGLVVKNMLPNHILPYNDKKEAVRRAEENLQRVTSKKPSFLERMGLFPNYYENSRNQQIQAAETNLNNARNNLHQANIQKLKTLGKWGGGLAALGTAGYGLYRYLKPSNEPQGKGSVQN